MLRKMFAGLIVCGFLFGLSGEIQAGGDKEKLAAQKGAAVVKTKQAKKLRTDTPTVQQLLDKVKENYGKIKDLKADYRIEIRDSELTKYLGIIGDLFAKDLKFYFKSPDKLKWQPSYKPKIVLMKNNVEYRRVGTGMLFKVEEDTPVKAMKRPWYTLLDPDRFDFYWRLNELIEKFDCRVVSNPETDIWVIEAVPKASNPEDEYEYPWKTVELQIFLDYKKGVIIKIGRKYSERLIQDFILINNTWIPTKFVYTRFKEDFTIESKEEYILSNIQLNTGISDSEFEF